MKKTKIIKINPKKPEDKKIKLVANYIKSGKIVAFPTETVYGLGADAFNKTAVREIFKAKNRPKNDPLIVHISDFGMLKNLIDSKPSSDAVKLMKTYWPGPLSLIFKKSKKLPKIVTGGLNTVAIRMPDNKIALRLIEKSNTPIAAPSANIFGRTSTTTAKDVIEDLKGKVDLIINGGKTKIGLESTVLDLTTNQPVILRPGAITKEMIEKTLNKEVIYCESLKIKKSPGMFKRHYAPRAKLILINKFSEIKEYIGKFKDKKIAFITMSGKLKLPYENLKVYQLGKSTEMFAKNLYSTLRNLDRLNFDIIFVKKLTEHGFSKAIMDRLKKAAYKG